MFLLAGGRQILVQQFHVFEHRTAGPSSKVSTVIGNVFIRLPFDETRLWGFHAAKVFQAQAL